jgi:hypothetical protein
MRFHSTTIETNAAMLLAAVLKPIRVMAVPVARRSAGCLRSILPRVTVIWRHPFLGIVSVLMPVFGASTLGDC